MFTQLFLNRLRREMPDWVARGWVTAVNGEAILDHATASGSSAGRRATVALAVLGVLIFGAGIVLFFAANWDGMAKIVKLAILFGGMWLAYGLAWWARSTARSPAFFEAFVLLGIVMFSANIVLIAQIYHISDHEPNAVLVAALGALAAVWLLRVQSAAVIGLLLTLLWSGWEAMEYEWGFHWPFIIVWALFAIPVYRRDWPWAGVAAMLTLLAWSGVVLLAGKNPFGLFGDAFSRAVVITAENFVALYIAIAVAGRVLEHRHHIHGETIYRCALVSVLLFGFVLTSADLWAAYYGKLSRGIAPQLWDSLIQAASFGIVLGAVLFYRRACRHEAGRTGYVLLGLLAVLFAAGFYLPAMFIESAPGSSSPPATWGLMLKPGSAEEAAWQTFFESSRHFGETMSAVFIAANVIGLIWLILSGYRRHDNFTVNLGFLFVAAHTLLLYFDRFWTLMDRSFFFMGGGLLLVAGGALLERQRRRLTRRTAGERADG